jgi:hypothetical protein
MKSQLFDISNQNIKKSIQTKELQMSFWQKASHYQFVLVLFYLSAILPLIVLLFFITDYYSGVQNKLLDV